MTQDPLAQRLWLAAQTDAGLLTRLRVNYRGRCDVLDALWWRFRPLTPTESGQPDPAVDLAELQARVYSREGLNEPVIEAFDQRAGTTVSATAHEHRLAALRARLTQDAAALDALLERMRDWTPEQAADESPPRFKPAAVLGTARESETAPYPVEPTEPPTPPTPGTPAELAQLAPLSRPVFFALGLVLGVVIGTAGAIGTLGEGDSAGQGDSANAVANQSGGTVSASSSDVLQIFEEDTDWADGGPPDLGREFEPDSIRSVLGPAPIGTGYGVYVAQRGTAEYCIVVQDADQSGSTACATARTIATSGLYLHARVWSPPEPADNAVLLQVYVSWSSTGAVIAGSSPRDTGSTGPYTGSAPAQQPALNPVLAPDPPGQPADRVR
ncbi:hypothetical protein E3T55_09790 [Cryobacterium frigoriphilum]|uniref:Uncharacterized protein n=1 Tax=Cryobacterium frigoriphilum TaxID=1259150 RepID=A0A4R9A1A3_9MICO|nr:hypothetical protein [Cryobacterium frigoriphilum]TFD50189.1 hypothetical protein E3T55_09790 [Cryobacterium frigoriphilum]